MSFCLISSIAPLIQMAECAVRSTSEALKVASPRLRLIVCHPPKAPSAPGVTFRSFRPKSRSHLAKLLLVEVSLCWATLISFLIYERYSYPIVGILGLILILSALTCLWFVGRRMTSNSRRRCGWGQIYIYSTPTLSQEKNHHHSKN